jgi:hypothetical protein
MPYKDKSRAVQAAKRWDQAHETQARARKLKWWHAHKHDASVRAARHAWRAAHRRRKGKQA